MKLQTTQIAKSFSFNRKVESSVWSSALHKWTPPWLVQEEYLKSEQIVQYTSVVILMYDSYISVIHTTKRQRLAWLWPIPLVFCSNLWWWCYYMWLCMFLSCPQFSFNSFFKHSAFFFTSRYTDRLLYMNISQLCSCQHEKGEKKKEKSPKTGSSLLLLPAGNNVVILFHSSDVHTGHHSQHLQKVPYVEGNNTLIVRHSSRNRHNKWYSDWKFFLFVQT